MFSITNRKKSLPFLFGMVLLFVGLTLSKAITSLVTVYMIVLFIIQKEYNISWLALKENKSIRWFLILIGWMCISLLWSSDKGNGIKLLSSNLNLFIWPILTLIFASRFIEFKSVILILFTIIVTSVSVVQFVYFQSKSHLIDVREMALFVSHIRFALMIDIAFFISVFYLVKTQKFILKLSLILVSLWLLFYTYYSQVLSGTLCLFGGIIGISFYFIVNHSSLKMKYIAISSLVVIVSSLGLVLVDINRVDFDKRLVNLPTHTKLGHPYEHKIHSNIIENGHYLDLYYCEEEVDSIWKLRTKYTLNDVSPKGYQYKYVVKRYLTSKGLTKDVEGMNKLTDQDIKQIEQGFSSVVEFESGLLARYKGLKYELSGNLDPNGHSLLQRFEFWKASKQIIQENWLFGVGIGGSEKAFKKAYKSIDSKLSIENQWESHNQFLTFWVNFGIIGLLLFLFWLISIIKSTLNAHVVYMAILSVLICSFLVEDTLGTLTGMTLFAFFAGLFQNRLPNMLLNNEL